MAVEFRIVGPIQNVEIIARGRGIRNVRRLRRSYGGTRWRKLKGIAQIRLRSGKIRLAEVHWYEAHGTGKKELSERGTSTRPGRAKRKSHFLVCIDNRGYEASLETNKIYLAIRDEDAQRTGDVRIVDESGEDYIYSRRRFVPIEVPATVRASIRRHAAA